MNNIKEYREKFVKEILGAIPSHLNPAEHLMEILNISRVSVYRRINCKVPFTYDELVKLSLRFGFSLDEIIYSNSNDRAIFMFQKEMESDYPDFFLNVLKGHYENIYKENNAESRQAILAINHVWLIHTLGTETLFKFFYYKWLLQTSQVPLNYLLEDVTIPAEILEEKNKICQQLKTLGNTIFIIDKLIYFNTIKDIQYYYRRGLIKKKELMFIKEDLELIMGYAEEQIVRGTYTGVTQYFYLSYLNIYTNSLYVEYDDKFQSFFYEHSIRPFRSVNPHICDVHKKWLHTLKKDSALISASNAILQADFFIRQKKYLKDLIENKDMTP